MINDWHCKLSSRPAAQSHTFLRQRGAILGAAMATVRGQAATVADVLATLDGIIDLEFSASG